MTLETQPDWSTIFETLANAERRRVLVHLTESPADQVSADDLAVVLTGDGPPDTQEEHLVRLRHVHLPKLEASGLTTTEDDGVVASQFAMELPTWFLDPSAGAVPDPAEFGFAQQKQGATGRGSGD